MSQLIDNLNEIKRQKDTYLLPQNLKKDVIVLGVTGTYEGGGQEINNQDKTITENGVYTADSGYTGLGEVTVNVTDSEYTTNLALSNQILGGSLPYAELAYIKSTGTQWIDTGVKLSNTMEYELVFKDNNSKEYDVYLGDGSTCVQIQKGSSQNNLYILWQSSSNSGTGYKNADVSDKITIRQSKNKLYINDILNTTYTSQTFTSTNNILLSNIFMNTSHISKMYIYSFKILDADSEIKILDLIPVKRKSDNEICMYDKVTNQFFTNQGTDSFIAGPEIN